MEAAEAKQAKAEEQLAALRAQKAATAKAEAKKEFEKMKEALKAAHAQDRYQAVRV